MGDLLKRYGGSLTGAFVLLTGFWLMMLIILPNLALLESSFRPYLPVVDVGGPLDTYSVNNYAKFFESPGPMSVFGLEIQMPLRAQTFLYTVFFSVVVTVMAFAFSYPIAFYLAKVVSPKSVPTLILLLFIPLWVSEALRAFAWYIILTLNGPLNAILIGLGILEKRVRWQQGVMTTYFAIVFGLVYIYILFMLFPIYNAMTSLDSNQIEAAQDLGAPWWKTHLRIVLPHAKPGIASGSVMVFMLAAGSLFVP